MLEILIFIIDIAIIVLVLLQPAVTSGIIKDALGSENINRTGAFLVLHRMTIVFIFLLFTLSLLIGAINGNFFMY